jgi:hypothetical protein
MQVTPNVQVNYIAPTTGYEQSTGTPSGSAPADEAWRSAPPFTDGDGSTLDSNRPHPDVLC